MRAPIICAAVALAFGADAGFAQSAEPRGLGEVMVTANRMAAPYAPHTGAAGL